MKFVVIKGQNTIAGSPKCEYKIFDLIEFESVDLEDQMRDYVYNKLIEMGKNKERFDDEVYCYRKNIVLDDGDVLAERIKVFAFDGTGDFFGFIPSAKFA